MPSTQIITLRPLNKAKQLFLPYAGNFSAGFPSPAIDYMDEPLNLNDLIKHPSSTFWGKVSGTSLEKIGIFNDDLLLIDKSIEPSHGKLAVCFIDGEFTTKRIHIDKGQLYLMPENDNFSPIEVTGENSFLVWGVVFLVIKKV